MRRGFIWLGVSPSPQVESFANLGNALLAKGRLHASRSAFGALLLFSVSMRPLLRFCFHKSTPARCRLQAARSEVEAALQSLHYMTVAILG
jgi:hypothetical protein